MRMIVKASTPDSPSRVNIVCRSECKTKSLGRLSTFLSAKWALVKQRLIRDDELPSVGHAERIWRERGSPTGVQELIDVLETTLLGCGRYGIRYAPIFLQRKKALQRGTWAPQVGVVQVDSKAEQGAPSDGTCPKCRGTGYVYLDGGRSATVCSSCDYWAKRSGAN
jgi:hypothetical protein